MTACPVPTQLSDRRLDLSFGWYLIINIKWDDVSWNEPSRGGVFLLVQGRVVPPKLLQISPGGVWLFP